MTSLYSLRSTPQAGEYTVLKLTREDFSVESLYALNARTCTCPQGHKPKCKHRAMLQMFLEHKHVDDGWLLDWSTRLWHYPPQHEDFQSERAIELADTTLMGNAEHQEAITRMAEGFASEGSNLVLAHEARTTDVQAEPLPEAKWRTIHTPPELEPNEIFDDIPMKSSSEPEAIERSPPPQPLSEGEAPGPFALAVEPVTSDSTNGGSQPSPDSPVAQSVAQQPLKLEVEGSSPSGAAKSGELRRRRF